MVIHYKEVFIMVIKKILVPIDGSDPSERAFEMACTIAEKTAGEIILLYVVDADAEGFFFPGSGIPVTGTEAAEAMEKKGKAILDLISGNAPKDLKLTSLVRIGTPGGVIARTAKAEGVDMIVMGNSGKGSISSFVMGSVSHYTVQHASCPVLIVK